MDFDLSERSEQWRKRLQAFFDQEVLPRHRAWLEHVASSAKRRPSWPNCSRRRAPRACGISACPNLPLTSPARGFPISNMRRWPKSWAGCSGRRSLQLPGARCAQHDRAAELRDAGAEGALAAPLLEAETRSAFGMTEPDVASSDATNIATTMVRDGDDYIINGRKWFITGAAHPHCSFLIVMGVTNPDADRTAAIPASSCRWMRPAFAWCGGCAGWAARITSRRSANSPSTMSACPAKPARREGDGFKVAQVRLGPARIHHCMRSIGLCELLIELMMVRSAERSAFGRTVIQYDTVQRWIAESRVELEQARLLAYRCAWRLDQSRPSWRLARRIADQGRGARDAAADRRPRHAGVRRDGRLGRYADPSGAGLGAAAAHRRRSGRGTPAADFPDGADAVLVDRGLAVSRGASFISPNFRALVCEKRGRTA
jgi:acyl-CoA dehydrogenase